MTTEIKTNEFLRRRKLRLQQVREQSKDIAKKIRLRAKSETLGNIDDIESKKQYVLQQNKFVKKLEQLYLQRLENVGASHNIAIGENNKENCNEKSTTSDAWKQRGKDAAVELKRQKQEKINEQKKLLDRKLQARETANTISREKSVAIASKVLKKHTREVKEISEKKSESQEIVQDGFNKDMQINTCGDKVDKVTSDVSTQWDSDPLPSECIPTDNQPDIPALMLPSDDSNKDLDKINRNRKNLFALSDEMPSSLRGGLTTLHEEELQTKSSLTMVSEFLQNRDLRLREATPTSISKKQNDDLQSIKRTILKTRASKSQGTEVCSVSDVQLVPVPTWHAEVDCEYCTVSHDCSNYYHELKKLNSSSNNHNVFLRKKAEPQQGVPCPVIRGSSPFRRNKQKSPTSSKTTDKSRPSSSADVGLSQRKSVTMYNHLTKDMRDEFIDKPMVSREQQLDEDAYYLAMKESTIDHSIAQDESRIQEVRSRVAATKQTVEKEYKDTMAFLNSLPKDRKTKPVRKAFMDELRQDTLQQTRQRKMQQEFNKIEKDCKKHQSKNTTRRTVVNSRSKSKSPAGDDLIARDFQYSWMPVPDSDENLAIHTIPNTVKAGKSGNVVKFSQVDSYHEYRSRHKHTPPTKDVPKDGTVKETAETQDGTSDGVDSSDTSSVENLQLDINNDKDKNEESNNYSDDERIIVYKILDSQSRKHRVKKKSKINNVNSVHKLQEASSKKSMISKSGPDILVEEQLDEGIYRTVKEKGITYESLNCYTTNVELWQTCGDRQSWWDSIKNVYFSESPRDVINQVPDEPSCCNCACLRQGADCLPSKNNLTPESKTLCTCNSKKKHETSLLEDKHKESLIPPPNSAATSTSSLKTCHKIIDKSEGSVPGGYIKLVDDVGDEAGKLYIGATGFLKDEDYEVVIQLRKKTITKETDKLQENFSEKINVQQTSEELRNNSKSDKTLKEHSSIHTPIMKTRDIDVDTTELNKQQEEEEVSNPESPIKQTNEIFNNKECAIQAVLSDEQGPRPATSTYTQTSLSPTHKPVYFHMSSSTSTAYMSPPELVHPKFLKRENIFNNYKCFEGHINDVMLQRYLKENYDICQCRQCSCKNESDSLALNHPYSNSETPPYSARCSNFDRQRTKHTVSESCNENSHKSKSKSRKSVKSKTCTKSQHKNDKINVSENKAHKKPIRSKNVAVNTKNAPSKTKINPFIEKYVNKLLALSEQGVKALQIVNQECSTVSTPGSSIINVKSNNDKVNPLIKKKISLEEIKNVWLQKTEAMSKEAFNDSLTKYAQSICKEFYLSLLYPKIPKQRSVHKVKSLNISKKILKTKQGNCNVNVSLPKFKNKTKCVLNTSKTSSHSKSTPTKSGKDNENKEFHKQSVNKISISKSVRNDKSKSHSKVSENSQNPVARKPRATSSSSSVTSSLLSNNHANLRHMGQTASNGSDHIGQMTDTEIHYLKVAEDKLQNIEKIGDLTEKCTQRLSNLAKVLEEVRKNKSSAYSQISTSDSNSDLDQRLDKNRLVSNTSKNVTEGPSATLGSASFEMKEKMNQENILTSQDFVPVLSGIPLSNCPTSTETTNLSDTEKNRVVPNNTDKDTLKLKGKPPTALSRVQLKNVETFFTPHELSTVVETDSPMSIKSKIQSLIDNEKFPSKNNSSSDSSEQNDLKTQITNFSQFNEIMLKPFISINEYAKQCNIDNLEEGSNIEDLHKEVPIYEDLSSLHSDGSLPDVIAELLKRNLISEPFKFETASTSSDSMATMSVLALSNVKKDKHKSKTTTNFKNKENIAETSDTLSISSHPDLENAFQKLGLGWASSTLKKTKERLALSSSNSSSSSLTQFKLKMNKQENPVLVSDSVSSVLNTSKTYLSKKIDMSKNIEQQTGMPQPVTVKEFLTNELSKRITFSSKSNRNDTEAEFVSLFETKIPDELRELSHGTHEDCSIGSGNNRARTSTPVQLFKSNIYQSSSSSNKSNELFSNADELSSVKMTSNSLRNHSTSEKDDLTIPTLSLRLRKGPSDSSKSDSM